MLRFGQGILPPHEDLLGQALQHYHRQGSPAELPFRNSLGQDDALPLGHMFRALEDMPELERYALELCRGSVLDIGAGAGCHTLELQKNSEDVRALDISPLTIEVMQARGVRHTALADIFLYRDQAYDTLLLLMNGIGLAGTLSGLRHLLAYLHNIVKAGGQILFDSSDIAYLYQNHPRPEGAYYGELRYRYLWQGQQGGWFPWLYVDMGTLQSLASDTGWQMQVVYQDDSDQYLCRLSR